MNSIIIKMKRAVLSIVLALLFTSVFGQIEQGAMFVGGTFSYSNSEGETTLNGQSFDGPNITSFLIAPSFGYMLTDNIGLGIRGGYDSETLTYTVVYSGGGVPPAEVEEEDQTIESAIGLFGRYYIPVAGDQLFFHLDLGFDIGSGTKTSIRTPTRTSTETDLSSLRVGLTPGFDYFVGEKWAIEANWGFLGYESMGTEDEGGFETSTNEVNVGVDFTSFTLGARWYF